jgi:hypothetical protein
VGTVFIAIKNIKMNSKIALSIAAGIIAGMIAMDYYNMMTAKKLNYTKRGGLFKYTSKEIL